MTTKIFSSESVTEGHPDKVCDQISDSVLDAMLAQDPLGRCACETTATTGMVLVMGEMSYGGGALDIAGIARRTLCEIGYNNAESGFDGNACAVLSVVHGQSSDIAMGVDSALEQRSGEADAMFATGAGDQGMMFGFACRETESLMPMPIDLAHRLTKQLARKRKSGELAWLRPDGKSMVSVQYEGHQPVAVPSVVVSTQHSPEISQQALREAVIEEIIKPVIPKELLKNTKYYINPTGRFVIGGPHGDSGLTGRKIIVDTYGGYARHGGGVFSGKDPTKVDRSAAYMARYIAKNIVAAGLAERCEIELAYAIGVARPVSVLCDTFGTGTVEQDKLTQIVNQVFDMRPAAIIEQLQLRRPIYHATAAYGHFGRTDIELPWERTDRVDELLAAAGR